ncbi:Polysaccharide biosynthesis/export protein [Methyloligella halotolerans]|uniref:Polysaccharide biosynthesis/export protein n=1 Tax=Methyloligella halotolerans TaxID=1177755 RepID=A0A1E2S060_9HYPH|nr:polysaccharide biosynthesis/export family protein [Methyloligella halotolerans]ODA67728.1 Polysaccharide biosynthesis/export protein [Methyloligella halotolerans]
MTITHAYRFEMFALTLAAGFAIAGPPASVFAAENPEAIDSQPIADGTLSAKAGEIDDSERSPLPTNPLLLTIGDQLKITVFEAYGSGNGIEHPNGSALPTLIERPELSGEYVVQQDGLIVLPLIGAINTDGIALVDLPKAIERGFAAKRDGSIKASVQLVDRQPVYVTGDIAAPATVKHVPGMTVLQAAILAGAGHGAEQLDLQSRRIELAREEERLRQSTDRLGSLLAWDTVLKAERDGSVPKAPSALQAITTPEQADKLVDEVSRLRQLEREQKESERAGLDRSITAMQEELTLLHGRLAETQSWVGELEARVKKMQAVRQLGRMDNITYFAARNDLVVAKDRWEETKTSIVRLERDLTATRQSITQLQLDTVLKREKAIREGQEAIEQETITGATIGRLLQQAMAAPLPSSGSKRQSYRLMRRSPSGLKEFDADPMVELRPGDVLEILTAPATIGNTAVN